MEQAAAREALRVNCEAGYPQGTGGELGPGCRVGVGGEDPRPGRPAGRPAGTWGADSGAGWSGWGASSLGAAWLGAPGQGGAETRSPGDDCPAAQGRVSPLGIGTVWDPASQCHEAQKHR